MAGSVAEILKGGRFRRRRALAYDRRAEPARKTPGKPWGERYCEEIPQSPRIIRYRLDAALVILDAVSASSESGKEVNPRHVATRSRTAKTRTCKAWSVRRQRADITNGKSASPIKKGRQEPARQRLPQYKYMACAQSSVNWRNRGGASSPDGARCFASLANDNLQRITNRGSLARSA